MEYLKLRPPMYYSSCLLLISLYYHVATMLLLFQIFKWYWSVHSAVCMKTAWIYSNYFIFSECSKSILAKQRKILSFQKGPSLVWYISLRVLLFLYHLFLWFPVGLWWLWENTAVLSWIYHMTFSANVVILRGGRKKPKYLLFFFVVPPEGARGAKRCGCGRRTDLLIHTTLKEKKY